MNCDYFIHNAQFKRKKMILMELILHKKMKDKPKILIHTMIRLTLKYSYHSSNEILRIIAISKFMYKEFW